MLDPRTFTARHIGPRPSEIDAMLAVVGATSLGDLVDQAVPEAIRSSRPLELPETLDEVEVLEELRSIMARNRPFRSLIGLGYYDTITPPVIRRNVLENPAWYTAYTPYQPEISQGRLEVLLTFQTMVEDLTAMDVANASVLDEATAAAEAMAMAHRISKGGGRIFWVDADTHPQTIAVLRTRAQAHDFDVEVADPAEFDLSDAFGLLVSYPGSSGRIRDHAELLTRAGTAGVVTVVATDLLALTLLRPPGEWGADIVVGSTQRFGVPLWFGGPHAAYVATRDRFVRHLPGRLVGVSRDAAGRVAYRLTLQTREQHIRRERATSNLCTAQVLLAVVSALYACWHGPDGLRRIAEGINRLTSRFVAGLRARGVEPSADSWFDTVTVAVPGRADAVVAAARERGINLRRVDADRVAVAFDETCDDAVVAEVLAAFGAGPVDGSESGIPRWARRRSPYLSHPVFHRYHSEHEMLRYLRRLADEDLALDRTMIPLGSCTMKLNPTTAMEPISWPEVTGLHPFAPLDQAGGYRQLIDELCDYLTEITGYDAFSVQPNSGAQGELTGLLMIRAYHRSRGDSQRTVCLIPSSAHGTNAASAAMAGMEVVVVACDEDGNVDVEDLAAKAEEHSDRLAALMVTYPSTHGVFESRIVEICEIVHRHGGQVYVDGANLNALVGVARLGELGADVSHLNLHKTFAIPHGGGGPGVGPVGVKAHLAPFLPNHPLVPEAGPATGIGPVAAAPWGSAGVLAISWVYIRLMGAEGLRRATEVAILNANYVAARLGDAFEVLYTGQNGRVAHECILDVRPHQRRTGISATDVAKRLADYGFHAPTLSFPVAGTLMVEPTESESKAELDRFCEAMLAIREEIGKVASGEWPTDDNPLRRAPHTAEDVVADRWDRPYSREVAAYPVPSLRGAKYWPPVARIDEAYGDRNLMCACPPVESYAAAAAAGS